MPSIREKTTHQRALKLKCFFCPKRLSNHQLSEAHKTFIFEKVFSRYREFENILPSGECGNCNKIVGDLIKKGKEAKRKLPHQDYDEILKELLARKAMLRKTTRRLVCKCSICKVVKQNCITPKKKTTVDKAKNKPSTTKKCDVCFAEISPGKHKNCNQNERVNNLMQELSPRTRMKLCLETLKDERKKKESRSPIRVSSSLGGRSVAVSIQPSTSKIPK